MISVSSPTTAAAPSLPPQQTARMRDAAKALEAQFLSEMLKNAGLEGREGQFSGGVGEGQFASMLRDQQAAQMVEAGGIGLAEQIFATLARSANGA